MNITLNAPPAITGDIQFDLAEINSWCRAFYIHLKRILYSLDSGNITELDASKIHGTLDLGTTELEGTNIKIGSDEFAITSSDGEQYLTLSDGKLTFSGTVK